MNNIVNLVQIVSVTLFIKVKTITYNNKMSKLILLFAFLALAAGTVDSNTTEQTEAVELSGQGGGFICAFGVILTPITGAVYAVLRCLIKDGLDAFTCIAEDLIATALTTFGIAALACTLDPIGIN